MPTMKLPFLFPATFVSVCLALCSCASVSVREVIPLAEPPASGPQSIFVETFEFEDDMVRVGREGEELEQFKRTMQQEMTSNLLERLGKYIAPAQAVSSEAEAPPGKSWLISGRFTRVNQGSRFLRGALGFGSGGTKMDVNGDSVGPIGEGSEAISHDPDKWGFERNARSHCRSVRVAGDLYRSARTYCRALQ